MAQTDAAPPALAIRDIHRSFYGVRVLQGVDFDIPAGQITGLIGPNGAGKSTLFNVVSGLYSPDKGSVRLNGLECAGDRSDVLVRKGLVRTFQLARGFPKLSVFQHLMLYGPNQHGENLLDALVRSPRSRHREDELAGRAHAVAKRLKVDHVIDNPVTALSGGQKKLVEIGRALMAEPSVMLLDEPMAGVNPSLADEIAAHLGALNSEGITICLVEHDMALIKRLCRNVIVMAEGRTLTSGSFDEVSSDIRVQEAYLGKRH
jgi:ABC-type branched-subunit amino acid transport system ATPase component